MYTTTDGFTVEVTPMNPELSKWDYRITVAHPGIATTWQTFLCGGTPIVDAHVEKNLIAARALAATLILS